VKFSLSNEEMKIAIEGTVKDLEKNLILRLSAAGIDFEQFNPDTFAYDSDSAVHDGIKTIIARIDTLKAKLEKF